MANLTSGRLEAIIEALAIRIAGENDSPIPQSDYRRAWDWAVEELAKRRGELPRSARAKEPIFRPRDNLGIFRGLNSRTDR